MANPRKVKRILNCQVSSGQETDWTYEDAVAAEVISKTEKIPKSKDLRAKWWKIRDQKDTGACVGFATADGVLRWHYVESEMISKQQLISPRFIWMANKETDHFTDYPTTFIESSGTSTKLALRVAQRYGCVPEDMLPMNGGLSQLKANVFYSIAASYRIKSYHNLGTDLNNWRRWLALNGPILTRLNVDSSWMNATQTKGQLIKYRNESGGGHAVSLVGYTQDYFVVRNSWGTDWGDKGFAYASNDYSQVAFTEAYGAIL